MSYEYPDNSENVVDSRSIIDRIELLKSDIFAAVYEDGDEPPYDFDEAWCDHYGQLISEQIPGLREACETAAMVDELDELIILLDLEDEASSADWPYGATLVRDSYFEEYAEELAYDCGFISREATWPINRIDWEAAADDLKIDYSAVDWDGVRYWVR